MDCLRKKCENVAYKCECESVYLCKDHFAEHLSTPGSHKVGNIDAKGLISSFEGICRLLSFKKVEAISQADLIVDYVLKVCLNLVRELEESKAKYLKVIEEVKESGFMEKHLQSLRIGYDESKEPSSLRKYFDNNQIGCLFEDFEVDKGSKCEHCGSTYRPEKLSCGHFLCKNCGSDSLAIETDQGYLCMDCSNKDQLIGFTSTAPGILPNIDTPHNHNL